MSKVPLSEQIAEVGREIGLRRNVYPRLVGKGQIKQDEAARHLERISAALASLKWLARNETRIRALKAKGKL